MHLTKELNRLSHEEKKKRYTLRLLATELSEVMDRSEITKTAADPCLVYFALYDEAVRDTIEQFEV